MHHLFPPILRQRPNRFELRQWVALREEKIINNEANEEKKWWKRAVTDVGRKATKEKSEKRGNICE